MKIPISEKKIKNLVRLKNLLIGTVIFLVVLIFFVLLNIFNADKINFGLQTAGVKIGGMTIEVATEKLNSVSQEFSKKTLSLDYGNEKWQTTPEKLGMQIDVEQTIKTASAFGHDKNNIFKNSWQQLMSFLGYNLPPVWKIDKDEMEEFLKTNLGSIYKPAQNATLTYDEKNQDFWRFISAGSKNLFPGNRVQGRFILCCFQHGDCRRHRN